MKPNMNEGYYREAARITAKIAAQEAKEAYERAQARLAALTS